ncbi:MAG: hypothetical protein NC078_09330, partial [Ruminococcus sp.]|nr:hypothetical protein [Ruminococcus sp.]
GRMSMIKVYDSVTGEKIYDGIPQANSDGYSYTKKASENAEYAYYTMYISSDHESNKTAFLDEDKNVLYWRYYEYEFFDNGRATIWYNSDGTLYKKQIYINKKLTQVIFYNPDGTVKETVDYGDDGEPAMNGDGIIKRYDNGVVKCRKTFLNDGVSYVFIWYDWDGAVSVKEYYTAAGRMSMIKVYDSVTGEKIYDGIPQKNSDGYSYTKQASENAEYAYYTVYISSDHESNKTAFLDEDKNLLYWRYYEYEYFDNGMATIWYNSDDTLYQKVIYINKKLSQVIFYNLDGTVKETVDYDENSERVTSQTTVTTALTIISSTTAAVTETSIQTTSAEQWSETVIKAEMYVTDSCYSRDRAIIGSMPITRYNAGDKVSVIAITDTGYYRLKNGGYIHTDYISKNKPETTAAVQKAQAVPISITIKGKEYSTDLTELSLSDMGLTTGDIADLKYMTNLTKLELDGNNITDINILTYLTDLQELKLTENNIRNFSPLKNLTKLKILKIGVNNISDISFLSGLTNITELRMGVNNITDLSPLKNLTKLEFLDVRANNVSDISVLAELPNLSEVYLYKNDLTDLKALKNQNSLTKLWIDRSQLNGISALSGYKNATIMILQDNVSNELLSKVRNALPDCEVNLCSDPYAEIYGY